MQIHGFGKVILEDHQLVSERTYHFTKQHVPEPLELARFLRQSNLKEIIELFSMLAQGLNYLHVQGHSYNYLTLENLYLSLEEQDDSAKIGLKLRDRSRCFLINKTLPMFL